MIRVMTSLLITAAFTNVAIPLALFQNLELLNDPFNIKGSQIWKAMPVDLKNCATFQSLKLPTKNICLKMKSMPPYF